MKLDVMVKQRIDRIEKWVRGLRGRFRQLAAELNALLANPIPPKSVENWFSTQRSIPRLDTGLALFNAHDHITGRKRKHANKLHARHTGQPVVGGNGGVEGTGLGANPVGATAAGAGRTRVGRSRRLTGRAAAAGVVRPSDSSKPA